ncbi:MAG: 2-C-methyl-D-erythritol 4-phosphate cytidylyltransferase [Candidatus Omnitrophota bacterium]
MKHVSAIVLAAGKGLRFRSKVPKPLARIHSKSVILYSLEVLSSHPLVKDIVVVTNGKNSGRITDEIRDYGIKKVRRIVRGGKRRQDSVANALCVLGNRTEWVLIHDAARPFIDLKTVTSLIKEAGQSGAAILGVPVKNTVKKVRLVRSSKCEVRSKTKNQKPKTMVVEKTLNRDGLWEIQTPQVFRKDLIFKAYKRFGRLDATDDAILVEKLGARVSLVQGSYNNIKITTAEDLIIAEAIAESIKHK